MDLSDSENVINQYQQLEKLCKELNLDVKFIDMPLTKQKKECLKVIIPQESKQTYRIFAI